MKLTKTQQKVLDEARSIVSFAQCTSYPDWIAAVTKRTDILKAVEEKWLYKYWENDRNGIVTVQASVRTLKKLEEYGLITILYDNTIKVIEA